MNEITDFGFTWGPVTVTRMAHIPGRGYVIGIDAGSKRAQVYVSEKGRSLRFWLDHEELKETT